MIDRNDEAVAVMAKRLGTASVSYVDSRFRCLAVQTDESEQLGLLP